MQIKVTAAESGWQIRDILRARGISATLLRRLKSKPDGIKLNNIHATVREYAHEGDEIALEIADSEASPRIIPINMQIDIIYEDESLLILNKPHGVPVHPTKTHQTDTLANFVQYYFGQKGEKRVFRAVNRLDSGTGGLLCIAKDAFCAKKLSADIGGKQVKRVYEALVCGILQEKSGTIDKPIGLCPGFGIKRCVRSDGERAVTHYRVLSEHGTYSRVEIELETGRTHQIRVHFSDMGHPVLGDFMYGEEWENPGFALFSKELTLAHPQTGEKMTFSAKPQWDDTEN